MPFRRAKLTACRKVRGMYRRTYRKSSRYGNESPMAQAFPPFPEQRAMAPIVGCGGRLCGLAATVTHEAEPD